MSANEIMEQVENIKEKISDIEYINLINLIVNRRNNYKEFYKIDYCLSEITKDVSKKDDDYGSVSINYLINTKRKFLYVPLTEKEVEELIENPDNNINLFNMIESNDFNIKEFTSVNYGNCSVNIDIQSRNYMIVSVEKVEV
jgi:hypothetical protein